jgi:low affinity Fe/Cu permease
MKSLYKTIERIFENFSGVAIKVLGNSITFIVAVILVIIYLTSQKVYRQNFHDMVYDIILCVTFLGFFIIQKSFNKYSTALHLKMNELLAAHERASNRMVNIENKTEDELRELEKHYSNLADKVDGSTYIHDTRSKDQLMNNQKKEKDDELI